MRRQGAAEGRCSILIIIPPNLSRGGGLLTLLILPSVKNAAEIVLKVGICAAAAAAALRNNMKLLQNYNDARDASRKRVFKQFPPPQFRDIKQPLDRFKSRAEAPGLSVAHI